MADKKESKENTVISTQDEIVAGHKTMSAVGIDFGSGGFVVAVARGLHSRQESPEKKKRRLFAQDNPAILHFDDNTEFIGTGESDSTGMNPLKYIFEIKQMIGRQFSDPELDDVIEGLPFSVICSPTTGCHLICSPREEDTKTYPPTELLRMVFSDIKSTVEKKLNIVVGKWCIGFPIHFTPEQRTALRDTGASAGLSSLHLMRETTAVALQYGFSQTDSLKTDQLNMAFIDIGQAGMQVSIAALKRQELKILAHSFDKSVGGRAFDEKLLHYFAAEFKNQTGFDVLQDYESRLKLRTACENLKRDLSAKSEGNFKVEHLLDGKDAQSVLRRDKFEDICRPILERVNHPLDKALKEAGLGIDNIDAVEVVGCGSRIPAIMKTLKEYFGKKPMTTMDVSESVAKGCAAAVYDPTFKVTEVEVKVVVEDGGSSDSSSEHSVDAYVDVLALDDQVDGRVEIRLKLDMHATETSHVEFIDIHNFQSFAALQEYLDGIAAFQEHGFAFFTFFQSNRARENHTRLPTSFREFCEVVSLVEITYC